jgi:tetratricopeptide (TPR) repeat protein
MLLVIAFAAVTAALPDGGAPNTPSAQMQQAERDFAAKNYQAAVAGLADVVAQKTGDSLAWRERAEFFLGKAYFSLNRFPEALTAFDHTAADKNNRYRYKALQWLLAVAHHGVDPTDAIFRTDWGKTVIPPTSWAPLDAACQSGVATACRVEGRFLRDGLGVAKDETAGKKFLARACQLGANPACGE